MIETTLKISDIKQSLDNYVIGQEQAKKELAKAFWLHVYQYVTEHKHSHIPRKQYIHPHILLTGATGSGKTELVTALSEEYLWPMITVDMSVVTPAGYVGTTLSEMLYREMEYIIENNTTDKAGHVIIFCDEFDKIIGNESEHDVKSFKRSVQYEFLKLIETGVLDLGESGTRTSQQKAPMDLSRAMFVLAGNFPELRKDNFRSTIGFGKELKEDLNHGLSVIEKLTKIGMASQLAGRISFIGELSRLTEEQLVEILDGEHLVAAGIYNLAKEAKVSITSEMKSVAINHSMKTNTGARGLKFPLITAILDDMYEQEVFINTLDGSSNLNISALEEEYRQLAAESEAYSVILRNYRAQLLSMKKDRNDKANNSKELKNIVESINSLGAKYDEVREDYDTVAARMVDIKKEIAAEKDRIRKTSILGK